MSNKTYKSRFSTLDDETRTSKKQDLLIIKQNNNFARFKVMLQETIRNSDFYCNTALQ